MRGKAGSRRRLTRLGLLVVGLALAGCIPVIIPAPSEQDPEPYDAVDLAFIQPLQTTRSELVARLGEPLLERDSGRLVVYGAVQKTGVQGVLFLFPVPVPLGGDARELAHHLFIRFDEAAVVERVEVVRDVGCTSDQLCIDHSTSLDPAAQGGWYMDDKMMAAELAVIYARGSAADAARSSVADPTECILFVYQKRGFFNRMSIFFAFDEGKQAAISPEAFGSLHIPAGSHRLVAGIAGTPATAVVPIECRGGESFYVEFAVRAPGLFKKNVFTVRATPVESKTAAPEIASRGLLLTD